MKNKNIRKMWEEFINDPKYKQYFEDDEILYRNKLEDIKKKNALLHKN